MNFSLGSGVGSSISPSALISEFQKNFEFGLVVMGIQHLEEFSSLARTKFRSYYNKVDLGAKYIK
jgi:hypothetical protein